MPSVNVKSQSASVFFKVRLIRRVYVNFHSCTRPQPYLLRRALRCFTAFFLCSVRRSSPALFDYLFNKHSCFELTLHLCPESEAMTVSTVTSQQRVRCGFSPDTPASPTIQKHAVRLICDSKLTPVVSVSRSSLCGPVMATCPGCTPPLPR